jgi:hypothetical protein
MFQHASFEQRPAGTKKLSSLVLQLEALKQPIMLQREFVGTNARSQHSPASLDTPTCSTDPMVAAVNENTTNVTLAVLLTSRAKPSCA